MSEIIAGVEIPDTRLVREATELVRAAEPPLLFDHSRRVYLFGVLQGQRRGLKPEPELLYVGAMFHDLGLTERFRTTDQRFEIDGANEARRFLREHEVGPDEIRRVWTAIALHTTPGVPEFMEPEVALVTAGVETDVLGSAVTTWTRRNSKPSPMRTRVPTSSAGSWKPSPTASKTGPTRPSAP